MSLTGAQSTVLTEPYFTPPSTEINDTDILDYVERSCSLPRAIYGVENGALHLYGWRNGADPRLHLSFRAAIREAIKHVA